MEIIMKNSKKRIKWKEVLIGFIIFFSVILIINIFNKDPSVILQVKSGEVSIQGFDRGQSISRLLCIACPHIGAKVIVKTLDGIEVCSGKNEMIVSLTDNIKGFKVGCKGLENYENERVKIYVEGFRGGKMEPVVEFSFEEEKVIKFEKIK